MCGRTRVPEHHVLQERMVQPLQHGVHQDQEEKQGCGELSNGFHRFDIIPNFLTTPQPCPQSLPLTLAVSLNPHPNPCR